MTHVRREYCNHYTKQYSAVQTTVLKNKIEYFIKYSAVQYIAVQFIAAPHSAMKGTAVQKSTVQCSEQQCRKVQCNALPCYVMDGSAVHCGTLYPPTLVYDRLAAQY